MTKTLLALAACAGLLVACGNRDDATTATEAPVAATAPVAAPPQPINPYTEAQARTAIEKAGYTAVSPLEVTAEGAWKGTATMDGPIYEVSVDAGGNVNAQLTGG